MKKFSLLALTFLVTSFHANCQDTLRLMNGRVIEVSIRDISEMKISYQLKNAKKS